MAPATKVYLRKEEKGSLPVWRAVELAGDDAGRDKVKVRDRGFEMMFMSGFCVAGARSAMPDAGLLSLSELVEQGRLICAATSLPVVGDGDTGFGNAVNCKRTVREYAAAGFAGILLEDQVFPKKCGHVRERVVVPRDEAVARVRAACDARDEGAALLVFARTDARSAVSLDEALARVRAFADAGADAVFIDALRSVDEMRAFCAAVPDTPKMANMLEGGGRTPILPRDELASMGFRVAAYPLSLLGVSIAAMDDALASIRSGVPPGEPGAPPLPSFEDIQATLGFPEYFHEEARYAGDAER